MVITKLKQICWNDIEWRKNQSVRFQKAKGNGSGI